MRRSWLICLCLVLLGAAWVLAEVEPVRTVVEVSVSGPKQVKDLQRLGLFLDWVRNGVAHGVTTVKAVEAFRAAGYEPKVISWGFLEGTPETGFMPGYYHNHAAMGAALDSIQQAHPTIAHLDTLGLSVLGRAIYGLRITLNPTSGKRGKPKYNINGDHHGNESIGGEAALAMAKYLANNYGSNSLVTRLVNESDVWIVPMVNPDGEESHSRTNNHGIDINRNYGYEWDAEDGSTAPYTEPETRAMRNLFMKGPYVGSVDFHSGSRAILYPWGFPPSTNAMLPMDSSAMIRVGQIYYSYFPADGYGYINQIMYQCCGSSVDCYYGKGGEIAALGVEISYSQYPPPPASAIDTLCQRQVNAIIAMLQETRKGIWGIVRDSLTHRPLPARLTLANRWCFYTDPDSGDYHKYLYPSAGTYQITAYANGYDLKTLSVTVGADTFAQLDFDLNPNTSLNWSGFSCDYVRCDRTPSIPSDLPWTQKCLGLHDGLGLSLSHSSATPYIVLDMGPITPVINRPGNDFTVYLTSSASYTVQVTNNLDSTWANCGSGSGIQQSFDLTTGSLDSARYVRINGTVSLDAVEALPRPSGVEQSPRAERGASGAPSLSFLGSNPARGGLVLSVCAPDAKSRLAIYDISGRLMRTLSLETTSSQTMLWNGLDNSNQRVPSGAYFVRLETPKGSRLARVVLLR